MIRRALTGAAALLGLFGDLQLVAELLGGL